MTYAGLALAVTAGALVLAVAVSLVRHLDTRWWAATAGTALVLTGLTAVFDSLMIAADLFRYGDDALLGWYVWLTPVEDLAWPVVAALLLPTLWALVGEPRDGVVRHDTPTSEPAARRGTAA